MRCFFFFIGFALVSCSSYQRDFREAVKSYGVGTASVEGPWKGEWKSEVNGHHGPLWCMIDRDRKDPDLWKFRYRAGWGVFQFGDYVHEVRGKEKGGVLWLDDEMTLPKGFGTYRVKGSLTAGKFETRFEGNGDRGVMVLRRPVSRR